jgi:hypothetical protein
MLKRIGTRRGRRSNVAYHRPSAETSPRPLVARPHEYIPVEENR